MNETNITARQKTILNIIAQADGLSRKEIQNKLARTYQISKATSIRDLNVLTVKKIIITKGKGKKTKYFTYTKNPLLKPFSLDQYFINSPDERIDAKKNFNFSIFNNLRNLFSLIEIEKINRVKKSFTKQTMQLDPNILKRELERFIIELSWKSSKIEGNTYTLLETERLIKKHQETEGKTREEAIMILNHKNAFEIIIKNKEEFKKLSSLKVNQLHNILVKDLNISSGIRKQPVGITGTVYKPLDNEFQIKEAFAKLYKVINENNNPFEKALITQVMLPYIQPYVDGNKRTGRMLANGILLAYDCYPLSYRNIDENEFKKALILFYEQQSLYHLKRLFIEQLIFAYTNYFR